MAEKKVIVIGAGFGGLAAAQGLKDRRFNLTVIDKTNHHLFQPLLYQVATASLAPGNISEPIRQVLAHQENAFVIMDEVVSIDKSQRIVTLKEGATLRYDYLIVAAGARHSYFGNKEWENFAPGLKTISDAILIREKILTAFEHAEKCESKEDAAPHLRFAIVGGGPTGVEIAGAIAEIARKTLLKNFRRIKPEQSEIYLIEALSKILPSYPKKLSERARKDLEKMGVKVLTSKRVTDVNKSGIAIDHDFIETKQVIWAAGNQASSLLQTLNSPLDKQGRVIVSPDLSIPDHSEVFVIGDAASAQAPDGNPFPALAPIAVQQGRFVADLIRKQSEKERPPFRYFDRGTMATIGKKKAIAVIGPLQLTGILAWLAWSLIHIMYLITYRNRALVMANWMIWYVTGKRSERIIHKNL